MFDKAAHVVAIGLYRFFQILAWLGVYVFYRKRLVLGRENLRFDGPAIVIVNHPSTFMDVANPAVHIRQTMFYLANYGLFKNPLVARLLRWLFSIPVKRREDVAEGEARDNSGAFEAAFQCLERGNVLFIAAEGVSWMNRFVRPLKTGAARIALGAAARNDWKLDVKIIPIGLSYDAPNRFRSQVVVHVGQPIGAKNWAEQHAHDALGAVENLTQHLENQLKTLSIHAHDEAGERFLGQLEMLLQNAQPLPQAAAFERAQQLVQQQVLGDEKLREQLADYFSKLEETGATDAGVAAISAPNAHRKAWADGLFLLLAAPVAAVAGAFWLVPCGLPFLLEKRLKLYVGYGATVKFLAGLFTFPLAFWGAFRLAERLLSRPELAWGVLVWLAFSGYFLEKTLDIWTAFRQQRMAAKLPETMRSRLLVARAAALESALAKLASVSPNPPRTTT